MLFFTFLKKKEVKSVSSPPEPDYWDFVSWQIKRGESNAMWLPSVVQKGPCTFCCFSWNTAVGALSCHVQSSTTLNCHKEIPCRERQECPQNPAPDAWGKKPSLCPNPDGIWPLQYEVSWGKKMA